MPRPTRSARGLAVARAEQPGWSKRSEAPPNMFKLRGPTSSSSALVSRGPHASARAPQAAGRLALLLPGRRVLTLLARGFILTPFSIIRSTSSSTRTRISSSVCSRLGVNNGRIVRRGRLWAWRAAASQAQRKVSAALLPGLMELGTERLWRSSQVQSPRHTPGEREGGGSGARRLRVRHVRATASWC